MCPAACRHPHIPPQNKYGLSITDYLLPKPAMIATPVGNSTHMAETMSSSTLFLCTISN